jgi:peptide/nickel transport system permease protein
VRQYLVKRLLLYLPTILLVTLLVFGLMRVIPGEPALLILGGASGDANFTDEDLRKMRHELGTDRPIYVQYGDWIWGLLHGDLGMSMYYRLPVMEELGPRIPLTIELAVMAGIISFILAVPLGIISAVKQDSVGDYIARLFSFTGISIPIFVTGMVVIYILVRLFNYLPPLGHTTLWEDPLKNLQQLLFPALVLAFFQMNFIARVTRSAMLEVLREDYVRTARSKGLRERRVIYLHALKNASLPIITVSGWSLGILLGGTIIIERIFVVPGMGTLLLEGINNRDYTLIQADVMVYATAVLTVNLLVDLIYGWLDPRIRYA